MAGRARHEKENNAAGFCGVVRLFWSRADWRPTRARSRRSPLLKQVAERGGAHADAALLQKPTA